MPSNRRRFVASVAGTLALSGCLGGGNADESPETTHDVTATHEDDHDHVGPPDVDAYLHDEYGPILVDADDITLYMFDDDRNGAGVSRCGGDCESNWPPLTVDDAPYAGPVLDLELSTFEREDGATQLAVDGWPVYYYHEDQEPGDAGGHGVDNSWWVLDDTGSAVRSGGQTTAAADGGGSY